MRDACGTANVEAIRAARAAGVPRLAFVSAHDFGPPVSAALSGYYAGKRDVEAEMGVGRDGSGGEAGSNPSSAARGLVLRPGMIYGASTRAGVGRQGRAPGSSLARSGRGVC